MELYKHQPHQPRWISFENIRGKKGQGGQENQQAKGHAFDTLPAGESQLLLDVQGSGIVQRLWLTIQERKAYQLRAFKLEMFWDGADTPAVSVPLGDFFCMGVGMRPFENGLVASPEGRSFIFTIPMPFRTAAKIVLTNESADDILYLFFDLNYVLTPPHADDVLYFHAHWRRENPTTLGQDFVILPRVRGNGRFLGTNLSLLTAPVYGPSWWGEGEVKIYLDGDQALPTLVGTGSEDYLGSAWEQGEYVQREQGSLIVRREEGIWSFYRLHLSDTIFFHQDCQVAIQVMGGAPKEKLLAIEAAGGKVKAVTGGIGLGRKGNVNLFDAGLDYTDGRFALSSWVNFYREDDFAAVAYFYLDQPENGLPPLAPAAERVAEMAERVDRK